jgi:hypothetical protein
VQPDNSLTRPITLFGLMLAIGADLLWITDGVESWLGALVFAGFATAGAHILGRWLTKSIQYWQGKTLLVSALTGAAFFGLVLSLTESHLTIGNVLILALVGAILALLLALPLLIPLALLMRAARRLGRARRYSVIDGSDRRMIWLAWAGALLLCNAASLMWKARSGGVGAVALALFFAWWLLQNRAQLARLRSFSLAGQRRREAGAEPIDPRDPRLTDFGIGDEEWEEWTSPFGGDDPYRQAPQLRRVIRGSRELAESALAEARHLAVAGLGISLGCAIWHFVQSHR